MHSGSRRSLPWALWLGPWVMLQSMRSCEECTCVCECLVLDVLRGIHPCMSSTVAVPRALQAPKFPCSFSATLGAWARRARDDSHAPRWHRNLCSAMVIFRHSGTTWDTGSGPLCPWVLKAHLGLFTSGPTTRLLLWTLPVSSFSAWAPMVGSE